MSLIVNVRATSGGGKTFLVRQIMKHYGILAPIPPIPTPGIKTWGYLLMGGIYVLGRYDAVCGGADTVGSFGEIVRRINLHADCGCPAIFESLLWSTTFKTSDEFAKSTPHHVIFGLMDTPLELCHQRVLARRHAAGNDKPFPVEKLVTKYRSCWSAQARLRDSKHDTRSVPHDDALATVLTWLEEARLTDGGSHPNRVGTENGEKLRGNDGETNG